MFQKQETEHSHYWHLNEPNGAFTRGICVNSVRHNITGCGAVDEFPNSLEGSMWQTKSKMLESGKRGANKGRKAAMKRRIKKQ
tara:strand:- start:156 stop:404 length:249 start_codon:yes stop_codon:yes gene_type:complete